jgi:tetratricopeptide (TPR) repeat protein
VDYVEALNSEQGRLAALDEYKDSTDEARGIEASLAISYRLLDEGQQRYWRTLAVFPDDFDTLAAATIWRLKKNNTERRIGDLYVASMVDWDGATGRFRVHDLARDYARARLNDKERGECGQRHAAHYLEVLRGTSKLYIEGGDAMLQGLGLFDKEWSNIRVGQLWAVANWELDQNATKLCNKYPDTGRFCLDLRLHPRDRVVWREAALAAARRLKDRKAEGSHLCNLGADYAKLCEMKEAIKYFAQSLAIARELGDRSIEGSALGNLGNAYAAFDEVKQAIKYHKQALVILRKIGDRRGESDALGNLGNIYAKVGETNKAIGYYKRALAIYSKMGDLDGEGTNLYNIAGVLDKIGRHEEARTHAEQALKLFEEIESPDVALARARLEKLRETDG